LWTPLQREDIPEYPMKALREAIISALFRIVHDAIEAVRKRLEKDRDERRCLVSAAHRGGDLDAAAETIAGVVRNPRG
jgi:hypothetical protein